jgi:hypothetical protein
MQHGPPSVLLQTSQGVSSIPLLATPPPTSRSLLVHEGREVVGAQEQVCCRLHGRYIQQQLARVLRLAAALLAPAVKQPPALLGLKTGNMQGEEERVNHTENQRPLIVLLGCHAC